MSRNVAEGWEVLSAGWGRRSEVLHLGLGTPLGSTTSSTAQVLSVQLLPGGWEDQARAGRVPWYSTGPGLQRQAAPVGEGRPSPPGASLLLTPGVILISKQGVGIRSLNLACSIWPVTGALVARVVCCFHPPGTCPYLGSHMPTEGSLTRQQDKESYHLSS